MKRIRLGICIGDKEYGERFTSCLAHHYREQIELHLFSELHTMQEAEHELTAMLLSDCMDSEIKMETSDIPVFYLCDLENDQSLDKEGVYCVEKYQEVNKIIEEIMLHIGEEIVSVQRDGHLPARTNIFAVYSLSENEYQLPVAVTLASILSENERVLLIDLQENSGLTQISGNENGAGLEELLVMMESGKYVSNRILSSIGHVEKVDYIYPVQNTECICETSAATYQRLIRMLSQEKGYNTVILNLGSRFAGFFELLRECQEIYLLKGRGGISQWRYHEFEREISSHGEDCHIREMEIPPITNPVYSCEGLVEQWKWNEFGDRIRRMVPGVMSCG